MRFADRAIQIQVQPLKRNAFLNQVNPCAGQIHQRRQVLWRTQHLSLEPTHLAGGLRSVELELQPAVKLNAKCLSSPVTPWTPLSKRPETLGLQG